MKYQKIAEERHFFDFVFYETEKDKMFIYCPNCDGEHEINMKDIVPKYEKSRVAWIKKNYQPCCCFDGKLQPKFLRTDCEYASIGTEHDFGEFRKNADGSVTVEAYRQTTSFAASNYCYARPFRRIPEFETQNSTTFTFREGEKTKIETCLYIPMCTHRIKVGYTWRNVKNWSGTIEFALLEESFEELKGTYLEKYIDDMYKFQEELSKYTNIDKTPMGEYTVQFLRLLCENSAFQKVWKAGFYTLAIQRVFDTILPNEGYYGTPTYFLFGSYIDKKWTGQVLNWRGKTLEKIMKVNIQKLDNLYERDELNFDELKNVIKLDKLGISYSLENAKIVSSWRFDDLKDIFEKENISLAKMLKYIRNQKGKVKDVSFSNIVSDYYDYLTALKEIGTSLTADVVFPSALITAHDRATVERQTFRNKSKSTAFKKAVEKYKAFNFENDKFKIFVIGKLESLMLEAQHLHNCSAGYVDRIIGGTSVIFLIREKKHPRKPFYMLELNPKTWNIVQNRGYRNCSETDKVKKFAEQWQRTVVIPTVNKLKLAA